MHRALSPVVGVTLLVAITILLAGALLLLVTGPAFEQATPVQVAIDLEAVATDRTLVFVHRGGDPVDVTSLGIELSVDGQPIPHQPPVPFVGAEGFVGAPGGAFNGQTSNDWSIGERCTLRLASGNGELRAGSEVSATLTVEGQLVGTLTTTARRLRGRSRSRRSRSPGCRADPGGDGAAFRTQRLRTAALPSTRRRRT